MITVGIDIGLENTKIAVLGAGEKPVCRMVSSGLEQRKNNAEALLKAVLDELGCGEPDGIVVTGQGVSDLPGLYHVTEPIADAAYAWNVNPGAQMVVDVGADQVRVVSLGENPKLEGVVLNQKCSACIGLSLETLALQLGMTMEELSSVDTESCGEVAVNSGCSVFSELGALEHLFDGRAPEEVAAAVIRAAAVRVNALLHDKFEPARENSLLIGGLAQNRAFVKALEKRSGIRFGVPEDPIYGCAIGCAVIAKNRAEDKAK